jgi:hypothetical protein
MSTPSPCTLPAFSEVFAKKCNFLCTLEVKLCRLIHPVYTSTLLHVHHVYTSTLLHYTIFLFFVFVRKLFCVRLARR